MKRWEELTASERIAVQIACEESFPAFMRLAFWFVQGQELVWNWHHTYVCNELVRVYKGELTRRNTGSLVASETGESITYGLFNAQERGVLFIGANVDVYEGMVVGASPKQEDIVVNVCKKKQLTNTRASGSDEALRLTPATVLSLEQSLEFIADDELVEVTPKNIRMRKRFLNKDQRMKYAKQIDTQDA